MHRLGQSELARYIAEQLDRELIVKRASDLLNAYVGATEQLIRRAFEEAEREEAVLVLDEADTFLFSRDRAVRSWEISFTNECHKALYLFKFHPELRDELSESSEAIFHSGTQLGILAQGLFPDGREIPFHRKKFFRPWSRT